MNDVELISALEGIRDLMIDVATGGPRINDVNDKYKEQYAILSGELARRQIVNPNSFYDLWDWYGFWSSGAFPTYQSRRSYIRELINPLIEQIHIGHGEAPIQTGWPRVDRTILQLRENLASANSEEQFQAIGLLCRETLISLAQAVYVREKHPPIDGIEPSNTDGKRMLEAYIAVELSDATNAEARKHARSALEFACALQHQRTANFRSAALCVEATSSVVSVIAILSGRRDPEEKLDEIAF